MAVLRDLIIFKYVIYSIFVGSETQCRYKLNLYYTEENTVYTLWLNITSEIFLQLVNSSSSILKGWRVLLTRSPTFSFLFFYSKVQSTEAARGRGIR